MNAVFKLKKMLLVLGGLVTSSMAIAQTKNTWDGMTFYTQRITKLSDADLDKEIGANNVWNNLSKEEMERKNQRLIALRNEAVNRQHRSLFVGEFLLETPREAWPAIKTLIKSVPQGLQKGFLAPLSARVDLIDGFEQAYNRLPEDSRQLVYDKGAKYLDAGYYKTTKYNDYEEMIKRTMPTIIMSARKEFPDNYTQKLNDFAKSLPNKYFQEKVQTEIDASKTKAFDVKTTSFSDANKPVKEMIFSVDEVLDDKSTVAAEGINAEQKAYYASKLYQKDYNELSKQVKSVKEQLRNTNLSVEQVKQKQDELKKLVLHMDATYSGFAIATNNRLNSVEGKLDKQGKQLDEVLAEITSQNSPLDERIESFEKMLKMGNKSPIPIERVQKYLNRDRDVLQKQKFADGLAIANKAIAYGDAGLAIMKKYKIGSESLQKIVGKGLEFGKIGMSVLAGFSAGGPIGGVVAGLGALLGGGGGPSPEYQMLEKIDQRLDRLEENMNLEFRTLHDTLQRNHKDLVNRLQFMQSNMADMRAEMNKNHQQVMSELALINQKLNYIIQQNNRLDSKLTSLQTKNIEQCEIPFAQFKQYQQNNIIEDQTIPTLNAFSNAANCPTCLQGLLDMLNTNFVDGDNRTMFDYTVDVQESDQVGKGERYFDQKQLFRKLVNTWSARWNGSLNIAARDTAIYAMTFPTTKVTEHLFPYYKLRDYKAALNSDIHITFKAAYDNLDYMNYKKVVRFANYVTEFYPLLELYDSEQSRRLLTPGEIRQQKNFIQIRGEKLEKYGLRPLLRLLDKAIAQESLMMGSMLFDQFKNKLSTRNMTEIDSLGPELEIFKFLESNSVMAQNFASYLIASTIKTNEKFDQNLKKYDDGIARSISFQNLIDMGDSQWFFMESNIDGLALSIQKTWYVKGRGAVSKSISIPLIKNTNPAYDANGQVTGFTEQYVVDEMTPTEGMVELAAAREKVKALLIEVNLIKEALKNSEKDKEGELTKNDLDFLLNYDIIINKAYQQRLPALLPNLKSYYTVSGKSDICEGDTLKLLATTGYNYKWYKDGNLLAGAIGNELTIKQAGNYYLVMTTQDATPTPLPNSDTVSVLVKGVKAIITSDGPTSVYEPNIVTLRANQGTGLVYQWRLNNSDLIEGVQSIYSANTSGDYSVVIRKDGCTSVSEVTRVIVQKALAVSVDNESVVSIFPNPTKGRVYVEIQWQVHETVKIDIINLVGQLVKESFYELKPGNQKIALGLSEVPTGVYFIRLTSGKKRSISRLIKE